MTGLSPGLPGWEWTPEDPASLAALEPWQEQGAPLPRCGEIPLENTTLTLCDSAMEYALVNALIFPFRIIG